VDLDTVKKYFSNGEVVDLYARAANSLGLWTSEKMVFHKLFKDTDRLLDLGCGAGRIALGLCAEGYKDIIGIDYSNAMIAEARRVARARCLQVPFLVGEATQLKISDLELDGVIFGFNGLMHIPRREGRRQAIGEVFRILRHGGMFVFTTHDRATANFRKFWRREKMVWRSGKQKKELDDFGDRFESTPLGDLFIHVPSIEEIRQDLKARGFKIEADFRRSQIANESSAVREFSDDCRFWIVRKPGHS